MYGPFLDMGYFNLFIYLFIFASLHVVRDVSTGRIQLVQIHW